MNALYDVYDDWIKAYRVRVANTVGMCYSATLEMCAVFPELLRKRGYVLLSDGSSRCHWWCEGIDHSVHDPTGNQWAPLHIFEYTEFSENKHGPEPIGKCMNCGSYVYNKQFGSLACTEKCNKELEESCS